MTDRELSTIDETCGAPELYFTLNLRGQPENSAMAQVFINNLNIKPLDRSIKEVVDCFSCAWHKKHTHKIGLVDDMMPRSLLKPEKQQQRVEPLFKRFELRHIIPQYSFLPMKPTLLLEPLSSEVVQW
jgi:hypothetical protein